MQPIRDKDFDQLFKDTFADAEVTPSRDLWSNIESEVTPKKKRIVPIYWLSAAAVLLIATVGILIYQQQSIKPKQFAHYVEPKVKKSIVKTPLFKDSLITSVASIEKRRKTLPIGTKPVDALVNTKQIKVQPQEKQKLITVPERQKQETMIVKVDEPKKDIRTKIEEAILQPKEETIIAANPTVIKVADEVIGENDQAESKGIRNVGDVVNLIVNKMDKRKDKFIQFRTDDDDSSISSINIGPFKIGKRNKK